MKENKKQPKNILSAFLNKIKLPSIKNISRPNDIPPIVPDCGWNHGEGKNEKRT
jgi:hypothetical protein